MRPVIGVTSMEMEVHDFSPVYKTNQNYIHAIREAGGIPLMLPTIGAEYAAEYAASIDGLLLPGGADVNPLLYEEEPVRQVTEMHQDNDEFEFALIQEMARRGRPILGICRGLQVLNVALGGNLWQDIPSQIEHSISHCQSYDIRSELTHWVNLDAGSLAAQVLGSERVMVNTFHHQAARVLGKGLKATGRASDGVVEALESENRRMLAVQWHPECLYVKYPVFGKLFQWLVQQAKEEV